VMTATERAAEAIEAAEMLFADEMGATLDLSPAARMVLIAKIAAAIQTAVAEGSEKPELTEQEIFAFLNLLNQAIESGRLPPSLPIRTLRSIRAKLQKSLSRYPDAQTADVEIS
jgi:hypothetical protein